MTPEQLKEHYTNESVMGGYAKQALTNPAYQQAITARKAAIFDSFCNTEADQTEERDEAWRTMQNMNALERHLESLMVTGDMADQQLADI